MHAATLDYERLPRFPDGRIDYTDAKSAPVVACVVEHGSKILIAKRSGSVGALKNRWDIITGYIDNPNKSAADHMIQELEEELGIRKEDIAHMDMKKPFKYFDGRSKELVVFPVLIKMKSEPVIRLNDENVDFAWVELHDIDKYKVSGLAKAVMETVKHR
jgi:8-oxo-dGTP pyrophosphatase MutT (NUDIX family)